MKYQIISNSAKMFYKLANSLSYKEIKQLKPDKKYFAEIISAITSMLFGIEGIILLIERNIIPSLKDGIITKANLKDSIIFTTNEFLGILFYLNLVDIKYKLEVDSYKIWFLENNIDLKKAVVLLRKISNKLNSIVPNLGNLEKIVPRLFEEEEGIIEDWQVLKQETIFIIKVLDGLLYNMDIENNILLSLIPVIEQHIDKIINIYEPSDEEQARALLPIEDQDDPEAINAVLNGGYF